MIALSDAALEAPAPPPTRSWPRRLLRGRRDDPAWARPGLFVLLAATTVLYLWRLADSGWANAFYSAAAQAGSKSWEAFFYGSSDASNFITVDKTPAALWVMDLSVRLFGLHPLSVLAPQALEGVAAVWLLYVTVRRWYGPAAGLLAGSVLALTPAAVLMFRFNNPDALLTLLFVAGAYATVRAIERASGRWLAFAGVLVGIAFLAKMLQALLVVPVFALAYLVAAPTSLRRRITHLLGSGLALIGAAGWWVAIVELVPASARPYIGGSQHNSVWELMWGYNGLGRLNGNETGSVGGGAGGGWGQTGWTRLFGSELGGQAAWLLPAALILLVAGLWLVGRAPRTDRDRAGLLVWGGWLLVVGLVFSMMKGIFHPYYTVALAPAIGAVVAIGAVLAWRQRDRADATVVLALTLAVTAVWSSTLLGRSADWYPWLRTTILVVGLVAAAAFLAHRWLARRVVAVIVAVGLIVALAGSAAYALQTASTAHSGAIPSAGPTVTSGGPGGFPGGGGQRSAQGAPFGGGFGGNGGFGGQNGSQNGGQNGGRNNGGPGFGGPGGGAAGGMGGGMGGLLDAATPSAEAVRALTANASRYRWVAAAVGSNNAAGYQLATGKPVMALGGFNGSDPAPTLAQFKQYVAAGKIHYFISSSLGVSSSGSADAQQISDWVTQNFTATTAGGTTLYDLTKSSSS